MVHPMGFKLDDAKMKRAGLDYHEWSTMLVHDSLEQALAYINAPIQRSFAMTTKGDLLNDRQFMAGDVFVFGSETSGLNTQQLNLFPASNKIRLPMMPGQRSLNLSNAVAVTVFEAWRQSGYKGAI